MVEINPKTRVFDVAAYILDQTGEISAWKLQKLVYYSQAWSLVWDERPLFPETIEAWANGPVCRALFEVHRGQFLVSRIPQGDTANLDEDGLETIDAVIDFYGEWTSQQLSDLTHSERPWKDARGSLPTGARSGAEITHEVMAEYYESLQPPD